MNREVKPLVPVVRFLSHDDLDRVMEIELAAYPFPWTRGIFEDCIRVGYDCHGLIVDRQLAGYSIQSRAAGESHLLNLCVAPEWQRQGFGSALLQEAIRRAEVSSCHNLFLEVRPSNKAGIELYRRRGFYVVGERPDYYRSENGREKAIVMQLDLLSEPDTDQAGSLCSVPTHDPF